MAFTKYTVTPSGATFAQFQAGGLSGILELLVTANLAGTLAPTAAPTLAASGSGGTLAAGNYWVVQTETNGAGETTASPVSAEQAVTSGQDLVITPPALQTGNLARSYYVSSSALGGTSTGPFGLAGDGSTASTFTISAPLPANSFDVAPPTFNSTGLTFKDAAGNTIDETLSNIRAAKTGRLQTVYSNMAQSISEWNHGAPINSMAIAQKARHAAVATAVISEAIYEAATLIDANAGTFYPVTEGGVGTVAGVRRSWP